MEQVRGRLGLTEEKLGRATTDQSVQRPDSQRRTRWIGKEAQDLRELLARMDAYVVVSKEKEWLVSPPVEIVGCSPRELIIDGRVLVLIAEFDQLREGQPV